MAVVAYVSYVFLQNSKSVILFFLIYLVGQLLVRMTVTLELKFNKFSKFKRANKQQKNALGKLQTTDDIKPFKISLINKFF